MSTMRAVRVVGYHRDLEMTEIPVPEPVLDVDEMRVRLVHVAERPLIPLAVKEIQA